MKWEQSKIEKSVSPRFREAAKILSNTHQSYKTLCNISFPKGFSGKNAVEAAKSGMRLCFYSANALPNVLAKIGKGMTLEDNASFTELLSDFKAFEDSMRRIEIMSIYYNLNGKRATEAELNNYIFREQKSLGYGYDWGYTYSGEKIARERWQAFCTGAKTSAFACASGILGFIGDTLGGLIGAVYALDGDLECANQITKDLDYGGNIDDWAITFGVDTDSVLYTGARAAGQIAAAAKTAAMFGTTSSKLFAPIYGSQSYAQNYRNAFAETQDYNIASKAASKHSAVTMLTTYLTGEIINSTLAKNGDKSLSNLINKFTRKNPIAIKSAAAFTTHAVGNYAHQSIDSKYIQNSRVEEEKAIVSGLLAGVAVLSVGLVQNMPNAIVKYTNAETTDSMATEVNNVSNKYVNDMSADNNTEALSVGTQHTIFNRLYDFGKILKEELTPVTEQIINSPVAHFIQSAIGEIVSDAEGASHSFVLPVAEKVIEEKKGEDE